MFERGTRFPVRFEDAFPKKLVQVGDVEADNEYQPDRSKPARQKVDPFTGKRQWKVTVTDPSEKNPKRASFALIFVADAQPVPSTPEVLPGTGMRAIELEGLTAEPRVMGQGEFKYLGYTFRAEGYREAASGGGSAAGGRSASAGSSKAAA